MRKMNYIGFARLGNIYGPATGNGEYTKQLLSGHYKVDYDYYQDELVVTSFEPKFDEILNLGVKEFNDTIRNVENFLLPETAEKFKADGYLLKRSFLFYGPPGTGKTVLAIKLSQIAMETKNAIALYPSSYQALERMLEVLGSTDPGRFVCINLEEFDNLVSSHGEDEWTTLLDGQFQSENRLLLATTNYIHQIPQRLLRPGRFSSLKEIPILTPEARGEFMKSKNIDGELFAELVEKTDAFTVDELKEVHQNCIILGEEVDTVIGDIRRAKNLGKEEG